MTAMNCFRKDCDRRLVKVSHNFPASIRKCAAGHIFRLVNHVTEIVQDEARKRHYRNISNERSLEEASGKVEGASTKYSPIQRLLISRGVKPPFYGPDCGYPYTKEKDTVPRDTI